MKLYVGNLPWKVDNRKLKELFSSYGDIEDAVVITDKFTRRSKGFGFVTFTDDAAAKKAMSEMSEKEIEGRALTVNEAKPSNNDSPRFERSGRRDNFRDNRNSRDRGNFRDRESSRDAPMANPDAINNQVEDSINDSDGPEMIDRNSEAEGDEEDIETIEEAMEDAEDDEPAAEDATPAVETTEEAEDESSEEELDKAKKELAEAEEELQELEEEDDD